MYELIKGRAFSTGSRNRPDSGRCSAGGAAWEHSRASLHCSGADRGGRRRRVVQVAALLAKRRLRSRPVFRLA